jgi:hypothetical protein
MDALQRLYSKGPMWILGLWLGFALRSLTLCRVCEPDALAWATGCAPFVQPLLSLG